MKKNFKTLLQRFFIALVLTASSQITLGQSISASKIFEFLQHQQTSKIVADLTSKQFKYMTTNTNSSYGITLKEYSKEGSLGKENFTFGKNNELFMIIYHPATSATFEAYKTKFLTADFGYAYSYKDTKYFENGSMRIGINEVRCNLSFFCKLN